MLFIFFSLLIFDINSFLFTIRYISLFHYHFFNIYKQTDHLAYVKGVTIEVMIKNQIEKELQQQQEVQFHKPMHVPKHAL